jgi:hypothetical protein
MIYIFIFFSPRISRMDTGGDSVLNQQEFSEGLQNHFGYPDNLARAISLVVFYQLPHNLNGMSFPLFAKALLQGTFVLRKFEQVSLCCKLQFSGFLNQPWRFSNLLLFVPVICQNFSFFVVFLLCA